MDVGDWLRSLDLGQYEAAFRDNAIDSAVLPKLTADDLKEIGVVAVGHRRRLLDGIAAFGLLRRQFGPYRPRPRSRQRQQCLVPWPRPLHRPPVRPHPPSVVRSRSCFATSSARRASRRSSIPRTGAIWWASYLDAASAAVTSLGGHVLKKLGDGLMALFGYPQAQENDGERAVRAALAIQRALADLNARNAATGAPELSARIGLDSGRVVVDSTGEVYRRRAQRRRARAERRLSRRNLDYAGRASADRRPVRRRGQGRARTERRARKDAALPRRARQRRRAARRLARAHSSRRPRGRTRPARAPLGARAPR